jgi:hypothetical protein
MKNYYVNKNAQSNGDHEVHNESCAYLPSIHNRTYLGAYSSCKPAVDEAKKLIARLMAAPIVRRIAIKVNYDMAKWRCFSCTYRTIK